MIDVFFTAVFTLVALAGGLLMLTGVFVWILLIAAFRNNKQEKRDARQQSLR